MALEERGLNRVMAFELQGSTTEELMAKTILHPSHMRCNPTVSKYNKKGTWPNTNNGFPLILKGPPPPQIKKPPHGF